MSNPIPLLLTLLVGGMLMTRTNKRSNPVNDEIPLSLDYNDPEMKEMLTSDEDEDDTESEDDSEEDE